MIITGLSINLVHDVECPRRPANRRRVFGRDGYHRKLRHLDIPRIVGRRVFPNGGFRRPHFRQHFVIRQPLDAATAAQAIDMQLAVTPVKFEGKRYFSIQCSWRRKATCFRAVFNNRKALSSTGMFQK